MLSRWLLRDAQARMLAAWSLDSPHGRAAEVARVLSPAHPGTIARWGTIDSSLLDLDVIVRAHAQAAVGSRMALAIVGDVPVEDAVNVAALRMAGQPAGALPQASASDAPAAEVSSTPHEGSAPLALIAFRVSDEAADAVGARVFAAMLAETLTRTPSTALVWVDADAFVHGAWAALGVSVPLETLEQLNEVVSRARHELASPAGRAQARILVERAIRQGASARSEPVHEAVWMVNRALHGVPSDATRDRAEHTFDNFVRSRPHYLVSRGNTARASNDAAASRP
jgi:hypothetical protein